MNATASPHRQNSYHGQEDKSGTAKNPPSLLNLVNPCKPRASTLPPPQYY